VYRDHLLPFSETFIKSQAEALKRFDYSYMGSRRVNGLPLHSSRVHVLNDRNATGWIRESAFKLTGTAPDHHRCLDRLQPRLIHAHFGPDGTYALQLAQAHSLPLVVTFHGYDLIDPRQYSRRELSKRHYLRHLDRLKADTRAFIAVSDFIRDTMVQRGFPADRIYRHYIGLNVQSWQMSAEANRLPVILFVGRLVRCKGCHLLIEAFAEVARTHPTVELVIIGDGPQRKALEAQARAAAPRIRFLGNQPSHAVRDWMSQARVLCVPSIVDENGQTEALGIVILEAQSMGLPVVAFRNGGLPEALEDGKTGLLCNEGDKALTGTLQVLLHDDNLWAAMSAAAPTWVRARFDIRDRTRELESLYDAVIP